MVVDLCCNNTSNCDRQRTSEEGVNVQHLDEPSTEPKKDKERGNSGNSRNIQNDDDADNGNWSSNGRGRSRQRGRGKRVIEKIRASNL